MTTLPPDTLAAPPSTTAHDFEQSLRDELVRLEAMAETLQRRAPPPLLPPWERINWQRDAWLGTFALLEAVRALSEALTTMQRARLPAPPCARDADAPDESGNR